jgi:tetratricopeptide (TPR) repeat protein
MTKQIKALVLVFGGFFCFSVLLLIRVGLRSHAVEPDLPDEPWENYDKVATKAFRNQDYALAEQNYNKIIEYFLDVDGPKSTGWGLRWLSWIYRIQGKYNEAEASLLNSFDLGREHRMKADEGYELTVTAAHYRALFEIHLEQGKYDSAYDDIQSLLDTHARKKRRYRFTNDDEVYYNISPLLGRYFLEQGGFDKAAVYLNEFADCYRRDPTSPDLNAHAKYVRATGLYYTGEYEQAEQALKGAVEENSRAFIGFGEVSAECFALLGRIEKTKGNPEGAVAYYQTALQALRPRDPHFGLYRTERADVWNEIGRIRLKQGRIAQARTAYKEVIRLRRETATATHPNCADAMKGLTDVSAADGNLTSATLHAEEALKILDNSVVPTHPRIAAELVALASIHILAGRSEQAAPFNERIETILQKPLGPWKEDFLDTTAFYADLLEKAGKPDAAEALRQLHARQKDKR